MDHLIAQALAVAKRCWKYRWTGVIVAWLAGLIGAVVVFAIPDRYEASARIYVDTQSILKPLMSGLAVQPNVEQQVTMLSRTLISRPNVEKLIRMADLDLKNQSKADQESMIDTVTRNLSIQSTARDNLYTLAYRDTQPEVAKRVVQSLVSVFVESSLGAQRKDTATATTFINEQIKAYEGKLEEAENRLKEFRLRNINLAGDGKDSAARIGELSDQLERARLEYREATNARDAAKAQMEAAHSTTGPAAGSTNVLQSVLQESALEVATPEIDARLQTQNANLDALLQKYTEQHPDVVTTRKLIKDLQEQKRKEVAELRKRNLAMPTVAGGTNPAMQELARLLAGAEVQTASLRARVDEYQSRYNQALVAMKTAPQLEAEASQLNRDYAINKKNYEDLVARRESASISGDLDGAAGIADFRLIDPPRASSNPVAPNRLLFLAGVMVASLLFGLFAAFAASQLRPVFHDAGELRARLELPILGVVSRLVTDVDRRRNRVDLYRFGAASGSLVVLFVLGLTVMAFLQNQQVN
ncbi:MAG TPA: XrtA system polysaccharide chain length determinant [Burkholderiaceae bacterium]|jgi:polysaccharide chain length determinant protein (PEP-CTERM system associated)